MLQYDNQAWNFFALAWLFLYLAPSWWSIRGKLYKALFGTKDSDIGAVARTSDEKKKAALLKQRSKGLKTLTRGFWINFVITVSLTLLFIYVASSIQSGGEVNSFDPFTILDVPTSATVKQIKKAYKTMSLKWHPDKNPNNRAAAEAKFMMVAKAYEALTDPVAKENYEKFGNPDGKQSLEVSIGLPSWLLDADNRNLVLMAYLIIMVGLIPFAVWKYYSNSSKFGEKDVMYDTYSWYHHSLDETTLVKSLPETFAGSAEFREKNMPKSDKEKKAVSAVLDKVKPQMQKPKYNHPILVKGNVLMHAHLTRQTNSLSEESKEDLTYMLSKSNGLIDAMISVCKHQEALKTALNCIEFGQYVTQGLWMKDSTLMQLPHFTEEEVKHASKGKQGVKSLEKYISTPNEDKKGLADMTDAQKEDVYKCCTLIPNISVESKIFTEDDEDDKVYEGDLLTVQVKITRENLEEGEEAGLVHAPHFPFPKQEAWWIILGTKQGKIISIEKVANPKREFTHDIKFLAPAQGEYNFDLHVLSNAYIGVDKKDEVELVTLDNAALPEYKVHPDDAELDDEPTLFEEMLNANVEEDSDSEDESSDDEDEKEEGIKELSPAERKKAELQERRKAAAGDDSDSDDSSVEEVYAD
jgi:translocation protein SEC63